MSFIPLPRNETKLDLSAFERAVAADSRDNIRGYIITQHNTVLHEHFWQPYNAENKVYLYSLTKPFTMTAIGLLADAGKLSVDDRVKDYFPECDIPQKLHDMTIHHLLTMNTGEPDPGISEDAITRDDWAQHFFDGDFAHEPGSYFRYNSGASHVLSLIVSKVAGENVLSFLRSRLFAPLGFDEIYWTEDYHGNTVGGWGISIRLEDVNKLGLLYLNGGTYNGKRILSQAWTAAAAANHCQSSEFDPRPDWAAGYGYQLWRGQHNTYRGDGAFGQYNVILPQYKAVITLSGETHDMQHTLSLIYQHLLPVLDDSPLRCGKLTNKDNILSLDTGKKIIQAGNHHWITQSGENMPFGSPSWLPMAAATDIACRYCRNEDDTITVILRYHGTPHSEHITINLHNKTAACPSNATGKAAAWQMSL